MGSLKPRAAPASKSGMGTPIRTLSRDDVPDVLPDDSILDVLPAEPARPPRDVPWVLPAPRPWLVTRLVRGAWRVFASTCEWLFGAATLIVGLAVLAAVPVVGLLSLGYLLEAGGRVGRTGRLRDGFIGVRKAARVGGMFAGTSLMLLPLRLISSLLASAQVIAPDGPAARGWRAALVVLTAGMAMHIALSCLHGGRLRYFFWPIGNLVWLARQLARGGTYAGARDAVWDFVTGLRLPYYFWLGLRGFVVGFAWLAVPISVMALSRKAPVLGFVGGALLVLVLLVLPFLQMRFAAENRLRAGFELGRVLSCFGRAPWAYGIALFVTLLFALPLYLLKIEVVPREAAWLPSLFFVVSIFPSRLLSGWAYSRGARRPEPRHWFFAGTSLLGMLPSAVVYVFIVYLTQYTSWDGVWSLYEQHAFLLPVPFVEF